MVLHDNKWDKRAKVKYMQKHGIARESAPEPPKPRIAPPPVVHSSLPDFDDDEEYEEFISAARKAQQKKRQEEPQEPQEVDPAAQAERQALFAEAERRVERSKLNWNVKTKLGRRNQKPAQINTDEIPEEDIDDFLNSLTPQEQKEKEEQEIDEKPSITQEQEAFLDQLI